MLKWVGINLYLDNRCLLIKYDQLKMLTATSLSASLDGLAFFPHLLSTNHKSTYPYLNSMHAFTSRLPMEEAAAAVLI